MASERANQRQRDPPSVASQQTPESATSGIRIKSVLIQTADSRRYWAVLSVAKRFTAIRCWRTKSGVAARGENAELAALATVL